MVFGGAGFVLTALTGGAMPGSVQIEWVASEGRRQPAELHRNLLRLDPARLSFCC